MVEQEVDGFLFPHSSQPCLHPEDADTVDSKASLEIPSPGPKIGPCARDATRVPLPFQPDSEMDGFTSVW